MCSQMANLMDGMGRSKCRLFPMSAFTDAGYHWLLLASLSSMPDVNGPALLRHQQYGESLVTIVFIKLARFIVLAISRCCDSTRSEFDWPFCCSRAVAQPPQCFSSITGYTLGDGPSFLPHMSRCGKTI